MRRLAAAFVRVVLTVAIVVVVVWSLAAIWIDGPTNRALAGALCAVVAVGSLLSLVMVRPWWWGTAAAVVPFAIVLAWWLSIAASNTADWQQDVARLARAEFNGNLVVIRNVRDFAYPSPTAVVERWEKHTYDLGEVVGFDMFLSTWGARGIAHTISSWEFSDGRHLAISIETRKKKGQDYSALLGFFRQYELYYAVADERDIIGVRAGPRGEDVHLYRLRGSPAMARALLVKFLDSVNSLDREPAWYNALTHNCTTSIRHHVEQISAGHRFDWRILANGYLDELGYERHQINTSMPFAELRRHSDITAKARAALNRADFSARIREGLPARPAGPAPRAPRSRAPSRPRGLGRAAPPRGARRVGSASR
jgi:hypothetical protein